MCGSGVSCRRCSGSDMHHLTGDPEPGGSRKDHPRPEPELQSRSLAEHGKPGGVTEHVVPTRLEKILKIEFSR